MSAQNGHSSYKIILDGETVAQVGDDLSPASQQGYTGHVGDNTGLVYMQARYYDPVIGRFYSNDPVGFRDVHSFNRYVYANNNPYKYIDPTGMCSTDKDGNAVSGICPANKAGTIGSGTGVISASGATVDVTRGGVNHGATEARAVNRTNTFRTKSGLNRQRTRY